MDFTLLGAKQITSKKTNSDWLILHVAYPDSSYMTGYAVDTMVIDPNVFVGKLIEGAKLRINRSPDGKKIITVESI